MAHDSEGALPMMCALPLSRAVVAYRACLEAASLLASRVDGVANLLTHECAHAAPSARPTVLIHDGSLQSRVPQCGCLAAFRGTAVEVGSTDPVDPDLALALSTGGPGAPLNVTGLT